MKRSHRTIPLLVAVAVTSYFLPALAGRTFFFRDLSLHFLPDRRLTAAIYAQGQWPFWHPFLHGGVPLLANPNNLCLYPTIVLYRWLSPLAAINIEIVLHFVIGALATYALARRMKFPPVAAVASAVIFTFCGCTLSQGNFLNRLFASAYVPIIILLADRLLDLLRRDVRVEVAPWRSGARFVALVLGGSFQILAGAPETVILTWIFVGFWALVTMNSWRSRVLGLTICIVGSLWAALICAIQILPTMKLIPLSLRSVGVSEADFWSWPLRLSRLPELFVPWFSGRYDTALTSGHWANSLEAQGMPYYLSIYFGATVLMLLMARPALLSDGVRRLLVSTLVAGALLAAGKSTPALPLLRGLVPSIRLFRYPIKFLTLAPLAAALLAGAAIAEVASFRLRRFALPVGVTLFTLCVQILIPTAFEQGLFGQVLREGQRASLRSYISLALLISLAALLIGMFTRRRWSEYRAPCLTALIALDLCVAGLGINPTAPRAFFSEPPPLADVVRSALKGGRFYRISGPPRLAAAFPTNESFWPPIMAMATLSSYHPQNFGIPTLFDDDADGMTPIFTIATSQRVARTPWPERLRLLTASGVTVVGSDEPLHVPGLREFPTARVGSVPVHLYGNASAVQRPYVAFDSRPVHSLNDAVAKAIAGEVQPLIFGKVLPPTRDATASVQTTAERNHDSSYRVSLSAPGYLVLNHSYLPGWTATVDGRSAAVAPMAFASMVVPLTPGRHVVLVGYQPPGWRAGVMTTCIALLALIVLPIAAQLSHARVPAHFKSTANA